MRKKPTAKRTRRGPTKPHPGSSLTFGQTATTLAKFASPIVVDLVQQDRQSAARLLDASTYGLSIVGGLNEFREQFAHTAMCPSLKPNIAGLLQQASDRLASGFAAIIQTSAPRTMDQSRFLMEVEFLLKEFTARPERIDEWAQLPPHLRNNTFGFAKLRRSHEEDLGLTKSDVVSDRDEYAQHSVLMHPRPRVELDAFPSDAPQPSVVLDLMDLYDHAQRVYLAAVAYLASDPDFDWSEDRLLNEEVIQAAHDFRMEWSSALPIAPRPDSMNIKHETLDWLTLRPQ